MATLTDVIQRLLTRLLAALLLLLLIHRDKCAGVAELSPSRTVGGWKLRFGECAETDLMSSSTDGKPRSHTIAVRMG